VPELRVICQRREASSQGTEPAIASAWQPGLLRLQKSTDSSHGAGGKGGGADVHRSTRAARRLRALCGLELLFIAARSSSADHCGVCSGAFVRLFKRLAW